MATHTKNKITVSNPAHHFPASYLEPAARAAIKQAGLSAPAHYEVLSYADPAADNETPVIRAWSKAFKKSVTITAQDVFIAEMKQ